MNKPCPFCGRQCAKANPGEKGGYMECPGCKARGPIVNVSSDPYFQMFQASKSWNTRHSEKPRPPISYELPTEPSPYWWRAKETDGWAMVKLYDNGGPQLAVHAVNFFGESIKDWERYFPVGQWVKIEKPL